MYVEESEFRETVETLRRLRMEGKVRLLVRSESWLGPPVRFELGASVDPEARKLSDEDGPSDAVVDVADVLGAILAGVTAERFAEVRSSRRRFDDEEELVEDAGLAHRKFELVRASFDIAELRRRYWIKATSKNHVAGSFEWEVAVKYEDDRSSAVEGEGVAFATLRLRAEPSESDLYPPLLPVTLTMTLDREDVSAFADTVARLRQALDALQERIGVR